MSYMIEKNGKMFDLVALDEDGYRIPEETVCFRSESAADKQLAWLEAEAHLAAHLGFSAVGHAKVATDWYPGKRTWRRITEEEIES